MFRKEYKVEDIHLDCFGRVKPSMLLYFTQDVARAHCEELAVDGKALAQKGLFWAVIRHRVHIHRLPRAGETITMETWPMPTTRVAYPRSAAGYDAEGNLLFQVASLWVLVNTNTRMMALPKNSGIIVPGEIAGTELALPESLAPLSLEGKAVRRVGFSELDWNGHVNNTRYLDWICDLLPSPFHKENPVKDITICYLTEAREGEQLSLNYALSHGPVLQVEASREADGDGKKPVRVFAAQVGF